MTEYEELMMKMSFALMVNTFIKDGKCICCEARIDEGWRHYDYCNYKFMDIIAFKLGYIKEL